MELLSNRNVDEVILFLKKELIKTHDEEYEKVIFLNLANRL
jgi:coatomer subunit beta